MGHRELTRASLGLWATAAAITLLQHKKPEYAGPILRLIIPAAITTGIIAGVDRLVSAQKESTATQRELMGVITTTSNHLTTQLTEIVRSDQNRLSLLRGMLIAHRCPTLDDLPVT